VCRPYPGQASLPGPGGFRELFRGFTQVAHFCRNSAGSNLPFISFPVDLTAKHGGTGRIDGDQPGK
jgi:hypothetical protein